MVVCEVVPPQKPHKIRDDQRFVDRVSSTSYLYITDSLTYFFTLKMSGTVRVERDLQEMWMGSGTQERVGSEVGSGRDGRETRNPRKGEISTGMFVS